MNFRLSPTPSLPQIMNVKLTSTCNQKCIFCMQPWKGTLSGQQAGHMSRETWSRVKSAARYVGAVMWTGFGETLLHPRWADCMVELDQMGVTSGFSTNGTLLTSKACAVLAGLKHACHVNVSLDSLDQRVFATMRGGSVYEVLAGIENLVRVVDPQRITVSSIVTQINVETLAEIPARLADLGVREYVLMVLLEYRSRTGGQSLRLRDHHPDALAHVQTAAERAGIHLRVNMPERLSCELGDYEHFARDYVFGEDEPVGVTRACLVPWDIPFCDKDGRIFPCSNSTGSEACVMGNLREQSLKEIWFGDRFLRFRESLASGRMLSVECRRCTLQRKGVHPSIEYAGALVDSRTRSFDGRVRVLVRNTGTKPWQKGEVRLGTASPRDHHSAMSTQGWICDSRACTFSEESVPVGARATFEFPIRAGIAEETFALVIDGRCWIANLTFKMELCKPLWEEAHGLTHALREKARHCIMDRSDH